MLDLNKKERERATTLDKSLELIKRKFERDEVVEEDFIEDLEKNIKGRYDLKELNEEEISGQLQFIFTIRLRRLLKDKEIKEKELAELIDVMPSTITGYLKGNMFPSIANIARISKALDVSPAYLLGLSHSISLSHWNKTQTLALSIEDEEIKQILEILKLFISNNELSFLNFLSNSKRYIDVKQKLDRNKNSQETIDKLEEIRNKLQNNLFESLDKIAEQN